MRLQQKRYHNGTLLKQRWNIPATEVERKKNFKNCRAKQCHAGTEEAMKERKTDKAGCIVFVRADKSA